MMAIASGIVVNPPTTVRANPAAFIASLLSRLEINMPMPGQSTRTRTFIPNSPCGFECNAGRWVTECVVRDVLRFPLISKEHSSVSFLPVVCALRPAHLAPEPAGTAVDARLARQAHGHRQEQIETNDMDKQYCPRSVCLQKGGPLK